MKSPEDQIESEIPSPGFSSEISKKNETLTLCDENLLKSFESRFESDTGKITGAFLKSFESKLESDTGKVTGANGELRFLEIQSELDIHKEAFGKANDNAIAKEVFPKIEQFQASQSPSASVKSEKKLANETSASSFVKGISNVWKRNRTKDITGNIENERPIILNL